ncbi:MAG: SMC family ATPase [Anaerolineae bacterium]|nr:SMC family ATPase [Anaerolineae bacterium]MDW8101978.1 SMC family ATPase [Anaerolineae bacterium]
MIPLRIKMENFLSYQCSELDLQGINIACICGENGSGKSALLDAITWALWGKASRSSSSQDLVHHGADSMSVELEFIAGNTKYKVKRVYNKHGNPKEQLFLMQWDEENGKYLPITEAGLKETQRKVERILCMDYDTFVNSAFLVQGRAGEFTSRSPAERKEVLGRILNLEQYELLAERAKEKRKEGEMKEAEIKGRLKQIEVEIGKEDGLEEKLKESRKRYEDFREFCNKLQKEKEEIERRLWELDLSMEKLNQAQGKVRELEGEIEDIIKKIEEGRRSIEKYKEVLQEEEEIRKGLKELQEVRSEMEELEVELGKLRPLKDRAGELEARISEEKGRLEAQLRDLKERIRRLENEASALEGYELELSKLEEKLSWMENLEREVRDWEARVEDIKEEMGKLERERELAGEELRKLKEQLEMLGEAEASCPLCGQPLTAHRRDGLLREFQRRIEEREALIKAGEERVVKLGQEKEELLARVVEAQSSLRSKGELLAQKGRLEEKKRGVEAAIQELTELKARIGELEGILQEGKFAPELQAEREALKESLSQLRVFEERREHLIRRERELRHWELRAKDLEEAREGLKREEMSVEEGEKRLREKLRAKEEEDRKVRELEKEVAEREKVVQKWEEKDRELKDAFRKRDEAWEEVISLEGRRQRLKDLQLEKEEKERELAQVQKDNWFYKELEEAFGKNGVQAMIIENVLSEIEEEADRLVSLMTGGRMDIRFETQKFTLGGKVKETLDIKIADEKGTRDYGLYSGGEKFRVDLAIRVALARVLARRSGAPLSVLFVDEGFGTQDSEGLERVVEAINSIQDDFKLILVITHLEELKELFPVRIEVSKGASGSTARVVRVW